MDSLKLITQVKTALAAPLPGKAAQNKMAHVVRKQQTTPPSTARIACVLILLYQKQNAWHLVFIERMSNHKDDKHGGQIGFPGGQLEASDFDLKQCALRETEEEVGIPMTKIEILGRLTELYIPVSNFLVHPFVGYLPQEPQFILQTSEVKNVIEAPLSLLQHKDTLQTTQIQVSANITLQHVPYFKVQNHVVWGATAMMLSEFLASIPES
ncbi:MAG: CoA pyrophosphatase [Saprospiraceae bacterium]